MLIRISLGLCLALCFACASPTGGRFGEYEPLIRAEWAVAQEKLAAKGVDVHLAPPEICTFTAVEGKIATSASPTGWANGTFNPNTFRVRWNTETPGVLRHEAGHAILHFLDYDCASCYEHGCPNGPEDCP